MACLASVSRLVRQCAAGAVRAGQRVHMLPEQPEAVSTADDRLLGPTAQALGVPRRNQALQRSLVAVVRGIERTVLVGVDVPAAAVLALGARSLHQFLSGLPR